LSVYFVSGTGTDVGKTYVTALLVRQLVAAGRGVLALKPVASGVPPMQSPAFAETDTAQLLDAQGLEVTAANVEACSPWRFEKPLSPDMAAAAEGRALTLDALAGWLRNRIATVSDNSAVLIEGVGGIMSPITSDALNLALIKILGCPVILVAGTYLGAINHALTALEALKAHKVDVKTVVLNESAASTVPFDATVGSLQRFAPAHPITPLRRGERNIETVPLGG
jgi:dethiobiotin synthetase